MRLNPSRFVDRAKNRTIGDSSLRNPGLQRGRDPERDRNGPTMAALADEIR